MPRKTKTVEEPDTSISLQVKIKAADAEVRLYLTALETENLKLQRQVAKLQAESVTQKNKITVLEETRANFNVGINF